MQFGIAICFCFFILSVSRTIEKPAKRLHVPLGGVAALSLLVSAAYAFNIKLMPEISINLGAVILCAFCFWFSFRSSKYLRTLLAVLYSLLAGVFMTLFWRLGGDAWFEPGVFMALCALPAFYLLRAYPAAALLSAALSPLIYNLLDMGIELKSYGYAILQLGKDEAFDAQIAGLLLAGGLCLLHMQWQSKSVQSQ